VLGLVLASLALNAEHWFAVTWAALAGAAVWRWVARRRGGARSRDAFALWAGVLAISGAMAEFQGGFITEAMRGWMSRAGAAAGTTNLYGFALRWPPGLPDAHMGVLAITRVWPGLVLAVELGPVLLLAPWIVARGWQWLRRGRVVEVSLALGSLLGLAFSLLAAYEVDRSGTRFAATSLWTWCLLAAPWVAMLTQHGHPWIRAGVAVAVFIACLGGIVIFGFQVVGVPRPQYTTFVAPLDTYMASRYWNRLPPDSQVFDPQPSRSVTLFGRAATAYQDVYRPLPAWSALAAHPDAADVARAGFAYVYADSHWWSGLDSLTKASYHAACVRLVDEVVYKNVEFRRLYDVQECAP
jgi:hypothetical protein